MDSKRQIKFNVADGKADRDADTLDPKGLKIDLDRCVVIQHLSDDGYSCMAIQLPEFEHSEISLQRIKEVFSSAPDWV